jgi:DNA-binding winged helix-turn-helix (wHTH) protein
MISGKQAAGQPAGAPAADGGSALPQTEPVPPRQQARFEAPAAAGPEGVLADLVRRIEHLTAAVERVSRHLDSSDPAFRQAAASPVRAVLGDLVVDYDARQAYVGGRPVALSPIEYTILGELVRQPNKVVTTGDLMRRTRGAFSPDKSYVKVYVGRLRARLAQAGGMGLCEIETVRGAGYRLSDRARREPGASDAVRGAA